MAESKLTAAGEAVTHLIPDLFRLSSRMLAAGDRMVAALGLTSARWQVLGAIVAAERPQPVAWLARDIGGARQNVQRIVNDLCEEGLTALQANPHHKRAQLVVLTDRGAQAFAAAMALQLPWVESLSEGLLMQDIAAAQRVVTALRRKLDAADEPQ